MTKEDGAVSYCGQCGNSLREGDRFCRICGAAVSPSIQQAERGIPGQSAASERPGSVSSRGHHGGGGDGCSIFTMGVLVVGFFVLIVVANGIDERAGWAVVVFGLPVLAMSAVFLLAWHWAIGEMDRRNEAEARRRARCRAWPGRCADSVGTQRPGDGTRGHVRPRIVWKHLPGRAEGRWVSAEPSPLRGQPPRFRSAPREGDTPGLLV